MRGLWITCICWTMQQLNCSSATHSSLSEPQTMQNCLCFVAVLTPHRFDVSCPVIPAHTSSCPANHQAVGVGPRLLPHTPPALAVFLHLLTQHRVSTMLCIFFYLTSRDLLLFCPHHPLLHSPAIKPWVSAPASFLWSGLADRFNIHKPVLLATFVVSTLTRTSTAAAHR